ncbi:MAG: chromosomal replication initiator protein DnaA [Deltaproteobacteria bacterium]|nr:chromosomal replication initiator protein DnaA [Deltaproteobacteria bacterium]
MGTEYQGEIWERAKESIREQVSDHDFQMWVRPVEMLELGDGEVVLACPTELACRWVNNHFLDLFASGIRKAAGQDLKVKVRSAPAPEQKNGEAKKPDRQPVRQLSLPMDSVPVGGGRFLRRNFTFDRFVVGECNHYAYNAALNLASRKKAETPLYFLSKNGMGKSHLSQAVGHEILKRNPGERVYYVSVEDFANEMVAAMRKGSMADFKETYRRKCDVLLLEDMQYLTGKERTQVELAFTLDSLLEAGKKLIFTSIYMPSKIPKLHESLFSRLSACVVTYMDAPDFRTRVRILKKKALELKTCIPRDILEYLASELTESVRQLEGGLNGLVAKSTLLQRPVDLSLADGVVKTISRRKKEITLGRIKRLVCAYYRISEQDICSKSRKKEIVRPRQIAMYLGRRYTDQSIQSIGRSFNRYHATALHAISTVERQLKEQGDVRNQVEFLCEKIEAGEL